MAEIPFAPSTPKIVAIPPEIQLHIFSYLDPVCSTCLGLTCKALYDIHKQLHGVVPLSNISVFYKDEREKLGVYYYVLGLLLEEWAGPDWTFRWSWRVACGGRFRREELHELWEGEGVMEIKVDEGSRSHIQSSLVHAEKMITEEENE